MKDTKSISSPDRLSDSGNLPNDDSDRLFALYKNNELDDAIIFAKALIRDFPKHAYPWTVLGAVFKKQNKLEDSLACYQKSVKLSPQDGISHFNLGNTLRLLGRQNEAETAYRNSIAITFDYAKAHNNLGSVLKALNKLEEAEQSFRNAINLDANYAEAHCNLGTVLQLMGRFKDASKLYNKAININPNYAVAHCNLGVLHREIGDLSLSETSLREAIRLNPEFTIAHNNLANTLKDQGRLEEALEYYVRATSLNPDYAEAYVNRAASQALLGNFRDMEESYSEAIRIDPEQPSLKQGLAALLNCHVLQRDLQHPVITIDSEIKKKKIETNELTDQYVLGLIESLNEEIEREFIEISSLHSQIFRHNSVDLNCRRHKGIFNQHNVIPKFCFDCFKVQVEPKSILEQIKLFIVFDQAKFLAGTTRKCMIEMRKDVPGFYKGLVYTSCHSDAFEIAQKLDSVINTRLGKSLDISVKRGCSEYYSSFPEYKHVSKSGNHRMSYPSSWEVTEEQHDERVRRIPEITQRTFLGLHLNDVLIIRNWINYAKGLNDPFAESIPDSSMGTDNFYKIAKLRSKHFLFPLS